MVRNLLNERNLVTAERMINNANTLIGNIFNKHSKYDVEEQFENLKMLHTSQLLTGTLWQARLQMF